ncbi:probable calcium-binding protein CML36 [Typha latifolia]|uniref:probable calcium-binding protein CML36 n=1 Tax=Typha latifolia TaxID=4733 RepID=UPI003C2ED2A6
MKLSVVPSLFGSSKNSSKKKKKTHSISRADTPSSGSAASSDDFTPKSVLPSGDFSWSSSSDLKISRQDIESALRRLSPEPPSEDDVAAIINDYASCVCAGVEEEELREAFAVFDADGDGRISAEELLGVFAALGEDECTLDDCRRMIDGVDTDGDGFVCFDDFARMMDGQI